jgi:hypothetical protein
MDYFTLHIEKPLPQPADGVTVIPSVMHAPSQTTDSFFGPPSTLPESAPHPLPLDPPHIAHSGSPSSDSHGFTFVDHGPSLPDSDLLYHESLPQRQPEQHLAHAPDMEELARRLEEQMIGRGPSTSSSSSDSLPSTRLSSSDPHQGDPSSSGQSHPLPNTQTPSDAPTPPPAHHRRRRHAHQKEAEQLTARELTRLILAERAHTHQTRRALSVVQNQLATESARASSAEQQALAAFEQLRDLTDARRRAETEYARLTEELRLHRSQYERAQAEIFRAQEIVDRVGREREDAAEEAARARGRVRKMKDEANVSRAREEGRKRGFKEGLEWGRRVGYEDGRVSVYSEGIEEERLAIQEEQEREHEREQEREQEQEDEDQRTDTTHERRYRPVTPPSPPWGGQRGDAGTFSPTGRLRADDNATAGETMLAGASYMPAAHAEISSRPPPEPEPVTFPQPPQPRAAAPPEGWIPYAPEGLISLPPPGAMSAPPRARARSSVSSSEGSAYTGASSSAPERRRDRKAPATAPSGRNYGGAPAVFSPTSERGGAPRDARLSIIPEVMTPAEVTPAIVRSEVPEVGEWDAQPHVRVVGNYPRPMSRTEDDSEWVHVDVVGGGGGDGPMAGPRSADMNRMIAEELRYGDRGGPKSDASDGVCLLFRVFPTCQTNLMDLVDVK